MCERQQHWDKRKTSVIPSQKYCIVCLPFTPVFSEVEGDKECIYSLTYERAVTKSADGADFVELLFAFHVIDSSHNHQSQIKVSFVVTLCHMYGT